MQPYYITVLWNIQILILTSVFTKLHVEFIALHRQMTNIKDN